jgi:DASS family divalent anion:Na+ symporter
MAFLFLNSSQFCLLAWGLLPKSSQNRFDWIQWLVAAAPLGVFVGIGMLIMLFLVLRPRPVMAPSREGVNIQLALLGPVSPREKAMIAVLILTLIGWLLAPKLQVDFATVTIIGLLGTVFTGNFNRQALQELDWNYLIFYGVALSMSRVAVSLGLDRLAADAIGTPLLQIGTSSILFILAVACLNILVRFILLPSQSVLLLSLALIPVAPKFGVDPWVVIVTILSTSFLWFPPSQLPAYLAAYSASEGRLFSHEQSARINFVYIAITLAGLALSTWYWRFLGLL